MITQTVTTIINRNPDGTACVVITSPIINYRYNQGGKSMKHFIVTINASHHSFAYRCTTAHEAYDCICDAAETFGFEIDADKVMEWCISIKNNERLSHKCHRWGIAQGEGEERGSNVKSTESVIYCNQ